MTSTQHRNIKTGILGVDFRYKYTQMKHRHRIDTVEGFYLSRRECETESLLKRKENRKCTVQSILQMRYIRQDPLRMFTVSLSPTELLFSARHRDPSQ